MPTPKKIHRYRHNYYPKVLPHLLAAPGVSPMLTNRLGGTVEQDQLPDLTDYCVVTRRGTVISRHTTESDAHAAIAKELGRRGRRNLSARARNDAMTSLGMVRNRDGSYE